jgi:hypothetical protein
MPPDTAVSQALPTYQALTLLAASISPQER